MSDQNVSQVVGNYKKLFITLVAVTAIGIAIAFLPVPFALAVTIAIGIMLYKSKVVWDAFKYLMKGPTGVNMLLLIGFTVINFLGLVLLPVLTHKGALIGTLDLSREYQMEQKPLGAHQEPNDTAKETKSVESNGH